MPDNLQKVTLNLRSGDWDYITSIYQPHGVPTSTIIRQLVSQFVDTRKSQETNEPINVRFDL